MANELSIEDVNAILATAKSKGRYREYLATFGDAPGKIANEDFTDTKASALLQSLKLNADKHFPGKFRIVKNDDTVYVFNREIVEATAT